jgi:thiamine-phosphate pyrophosphorylase
MTPAGRRDRLRSARLYGILDLGYVAVPDALRLAERLLAPGGVDVLQLRAKDRPPDLILTLARALVPMARAAAVPFFVNDHPELAAAAGADGVHVGQDDLSVAQVRAIVGPEALVGKSTHSLAQARAAFSEAVDCIGFGPIFATPTKPDYRPIGPADIATVVREAPVPVFCIGGIKRHNLPDVLAAGAERVVIVSGLLLAGERLPEDLAAIRERLAEVPLTTPG